MDAGTSQQVLLVSYQNDLQSGLSRCALKYRWCRVNGLSEGVVRDILIRQPRAVVFALPPVADAAWRAMGAIASYWNPIVLVAVAGSGCGDAEVQARRVGATCFLPVGAPQEEIEAVLAPLGVLVPAGAGSRAATAARPGIETVERAAVVGASRPSGRGLVAGSGGAGGTVGAPVRRGLKAAALAGRIVEVR